MIKRTTHVTSVTNLLPQHCLTKFTWSVNTALGMSAWIAILALIQHLNLPSINGSVEKGDHLLSTNELLSVLGWNTLCHLELLLDT